MLIPSLKTQLLERPRPKLLEQGKRFGLVREQVELRFRIASDPDGAVVNAVLDPVRRDPRGLGDLRHCQVAGDAARMGLPAFAQETMPQAQQPNGAGQDGGMARRAMAFPGQQGRDLLVRLTHLGEFENLLLHFLSGRQAGQRAHGHRQGCRGRGSPSPDNTDLKHVRSGAVDDDLVEEAAQEGLLLSGRQQVLPPQFRDLLSGPEKDFSVLGAERFGGRGVLLFVAEAFLGVLEFSKRRFPAPLQFGGHQAVVRVRLVELPFGQARLIAEALELLLPRPLHLFLLLVEGGHGLGVQVQLHRGESIQEGLDNMAVDGVRRQVLADGHLVLLAEVIAEVTSPLLVLDNHFMPAFSTIDDAVEQGLAPPRHSPGLVASVRTVVVADHGLNPLERAPVNVGRILVAVTDFPVGHGQRFLHALVRGIGPGHGAGAAVDEGARVGGVLEDGEDGRDRRPPPDQIARAVPSGEQQFLVVEATYDLAGRLDPEEGGEDQRQAGLDFLIGVLEHAAERVPHQPDRQGQGPFAPLGLVEQPGRQAGAERVQLQFGDQPLQAQDQATIRSRRVVNAVLIADEAVAEAAQVEELIPIGAVAGQAGDVVGEDDADLLLVDEGDQFLEPLPALAGAAAAAEVGIDDADLARVPAGGVGTLREIIL